jgi:hypothetical protein
VPAADLNGLAVTLTNTATTGWRPDKEDVQYVHAWLLDADGRRLGPEWYAHGGDRQDLHDLAPGQSLCLPVDFGPDAVHTPPGVYTMHAVMPDLGLRSAPETVAVL